MSENLWPEDFGTLTLETPVGMLREQATALGQRTSNIVVGRVLSESVGSGRFRHLFALYCAPLNYHAPFLAVEHEIDLYPVSLQVEGESGPPLQAATSEELAAKLKEIFSRPRTKQLVASLITQSRN